MSLRILVVDDDAITRKVLLRLLAQEGHVVEQCADASSALQQLRTTPYDVILTDWVMPGMSGVELAEAAQELIPALRCVVMSGYPRPEGVAEQIAWVAKPITVDRLLALLAGAQPD